MGGATPLVGPLVALLMGFGCASDDRVDVAAGGTPPDPYQLGGQTGSLVPDCGLSPLASGGAPVPEGDVIAVVYAEGCPEDAVERLAVTDAGGNAVETRTELLDAQQSIYLVRAATTFTVGDYELALPVGPEATAPTAEATTQAVAVSRELPSALGRLEQRPLASGGTCEVVEFELELSAEALAFAPLLRLEVSVDEGPWRPWVEYGALELDAGRAALRLPICENVCLRPGQHQLSLTARVAGEDGDFATSTHAFDVPCDDQTTPPVATGAAPSTNCSLAPRARGAARARPISTPAWLGLLSLLGLALGRRSRRLLR